MVLRVERRLAPGGKPSRHEIRGFLLPEFVSLVGLTDEQRNHYETMKKIAPFTKLTPNQRMTETMKLTQTLNESNAIQIGAPVEITAYQLPQPKIQLEGVKVNVSPVGAFHVQNHLRKAASFGHRWNIVYSQSKINYNMDVEIA